MKRSRTAAILVLVLAGLGACASPVEWRERQGVEGKFLVPTCPHCGSVVDYGLDECDTCEGSYRWVTRPGEED